jgi:mercuric transport protein
MKKIITLVFLPMLLVASGVIADIKTVVLKVDNMTCVSCPFIVNKSLSGVGGVEEVVVDFKQKTATVRFDDEQTSVFMLLDATTNAGYPSMVME